MSAPDQLAKQLDAAQRTLLAFDVYLSQVNDVIAETRKVIREAQGQLDTGKEGLGSG